MPTFLSFTTQVKNADNVCRRYLVWSVPRVYGLTRLLYYFLLNFTISILASTMAVTLDKNTFFIYNKRYNHAKIAQWGKGHGDVGTYEQTLNPDQLWFLEQSSRYPGYYYIKNAEYTGYRLAKFGRGDGDTIVYDGQYYDDQLWRFQKRGNYYYIYNKVYSNARLAKWGKGDGEFGTYSGRYYDDQLWKLVPRFGPAHVREHEVLNFDNR